MSEVEQTCRICRGEATPSQPLMHPCKCRGSIKFIHQDCLLEWLNHSNNKEKRCDICNTAYQFKTIYDPEMPSRMPSSEIYYKLVSMIKKAMVKNTSIVLYSIFIAQLSIFWKFVGRLLTCLADDTLPSSNMTMLHTLLYGTYVTRTRSGVLLDSPEATWGDKCMTFLVNTFVHGNLQVAIFIMVAVVIFIEHEWVVREEGYKALLLRQMGKRPRTKLADLLASLAQNETGENRNPNELMVNRALEDLRRVHEAYVHEDALRAAIEHRQFDALLPDAVVNAPLRNPLPDLDLHAEVSNGESSNSTAEDVTDSASSQEDRSGDENDLSDGEEEHAPLRGVDQNLLNLDNQNVGRIEPLDDLSDDDAVDELAGRGDLMDEAFEAAEMAEGGNLWEVLGFKLDIITPLQLTFFSDVIIVFSLLGIYLVPLLLGNIVVLALVIIPGGFVYLFVLPLLELPGLKLIPVFFNYICNQMQRSFLNLNPKDLIMESLSGVLDRSDNVNSLLPNTVVGRTVTLSAGYLFICFFFHYHMSRLIVGPKPIMGRSRKAYEIMFQIMATAKVFTIFASEIILFPLYCGWLIDFCIAPLVNKEIVSTVQGRMKLHLLTSHFESLGFYTRFSVYWSLGTCYMFCVALFVSMIRRSILRSGVLYFIKSPEDPNARLIHDAIVKPFFLQISRILLSAKVYTAFVVLGIGSVTWGIRFLVNPPYSEGAMLPIQLSSFFELCVVACTSWVIFSAKNSIAKRVLLFWKRSFAVLSHKFRLSHFLLDEPVPQERGYVVYRSIFHRLLSIGTPDYSKPVCYSEAQKLFKSDPDTSAYFVPDGTYIRAPSSDDNSRKFLRSLFVPVTKSDQLISPIEPQPENEESDWWDENVFYEDNYTIVYTPPNNKFRCLVLVCMVILFGALLIVSIGLTAAMIGRPIVCASVIVSRQFFKWLNQEATDPASYIDWKYLDVHSLCAGLITLTQVLFLMDHCPNSTEVRAFVVNQGRRAVPFFIDIGALFAKFYHSMLLLTLHNCIITQVHFTYIPEIEEYFFGTRSTQMSTTSLDMKYTWHGFLMNVAFLPFTVIPFFLAFYFQNRRTAETWGEYFSQLMPRQTLYSVLYLFFHRFFVVVFRKEGMPVGYVTSIYLNVIVLLLLAITHAWISCGQFLNRVNEQIKNEKYVRGTAIQNIDVSD